MTLGNVGAVLTNTSNGTIKSAPLAAVTSGTGGAATVINAGYIVGSGGIAGTSPGVELRDGGVINNLSSGTINSRRANGVYATGGDTTLINAGTISDVLLKAGHTNRVEMVPGAVFFGGVDGGNPVGATAVSTLELTIAAANTGTLYGFGHQYRNFEQLTIDAGRQLDYVGIRNARLRCHGHQFRHFEFVQQHGQRGGSADQQRHRDRGSPRRSPWLTSPALGG